VTSPKRQTFVNRVRGPRPATYEDGARESGAYFLLHPPDWVHRHVEQLTIETEKIAYRRLTIDLELPADEGAWFDCDGDDAFYFVPLTRMAKDPPTSRVDLRNESGESLPLLTRSENAQHSILAFLSGYEQSTGRVPPEDLSEWLDLAVTDTGAQARLGSGHAAAIAESEPFDALRASKAFKEAALDAAANSLLWTVLRGRPGQRRIIKFGYRVPLQADNLIVRRRVTHHWQETFEKKTYELSELRDGGTLWWATVRALARRVGATLGMAGIQVSSLVPNIAEADSFHFQVLAPPGVDVRRIRLRGDVLDENGKPLKPATQYEGNSGHMYFSGVKAAVPPPTEDADVERWWRLLLQRQERPKPAPVVTDAADGAPDPDEQRAGDAPEGSTEDDAGNEGAHAKVKRTAEQASADLPPAIEDEQRAASPHRPPISIEVGLRVARRGFFNLSVLSALVIAGALWAYHRDYEVASKANNNQVTAAALLVVPALLVIFATRPEEHAWSARLLAGVRGLMLASALLAAAGAIALAGVAPLNDERDTVRMYAIAASAIAVVLSLSWIASWERGRWWVRRRPSPRVFALVTALWTLAAVAIPALGWADLLSVRVTPPAVIAITWVVFALSGGPLFLGVRIWRDEHVPLGLWRTTLGAPLIALFAALAASHALTWLIDLRAMWIALSCVALGLLAAVGGALLRPPERRSPAPGGEVAGS
jgi:hypothetical protein